MLVVFLHCIKRNLSSHYLLFCVEDMSDYISNNYFDYMFQCVIKEPDDNFEMIIFYYEYDDKK